MKANVVRYLKTFGDKTFREVPFSEVDALVLSLLSYLKMEGVVPGFREGCGIGWEELKAQENFEQLFSDPIFGPSYRSIFQLVSKSVRYRKLRIGFFQEWLDVREEAQFAAVTFWLGDTSLFLSFRGTDETLVGWKEDFNMGYMRTVPSQRRALAYLKGVARYTEGRLILGGHSKGGNLAVFASAGAPETIQKRIRRIYSFDGPGFRKSFYESPGFCAIKGRFCKIVPRQSLIGMLLSNYRGFRVVESYKAGVIQHDVLQWKIRDGKFVYRKELHRKSDRHVQLLNAWIDSLSRDQIFEFVQTLYELMRSASSGSVYELAQGKVATLRTVRRSYRRLEPSRQKSFRESVRKLVRIIAEGYFPKNQKSKTCNSEPFEL